MSRGGSHQRGKKFFRLSRGVKGQFQGGRSNGGGRQHYSTRFCSERGNFAYVAGTMIDGMLNNYVDEVIDNTWCLDSRASHHMSHSIEQFYDAQPYLDMTSIIIKDGKTLKHFAYWYD